MRTLTLVFLFVSSWLIAQPTLHPSIGLDALPLETDSICDIPLYLGNFDNSGLQIGDTAADFTLYDLNGEPFHLKDMLESGLPVVLVGGNYTCPVFRNKIPALNNLVDMYGDSVFFAVIYGLEAHPDVDISPYFGYVNTGAQNISAGILYRQPTTYGERLEVAEDMLGEINIEAPIYFDGPCNEWWAHYGPAPNNAYLIGTDGIVHAKHGWFNRYPDDMACDLDNYFNGDCDPGSGGNNGQFSFQKVSQDTVYGPPGMTIYTEAELINEGTEPVEILVKRLINDLPGGWESSLCIDVCYPTSVDSVVILLEPGEIQHFIFYFYTDSHSEGEGYGRIGFRNTADFQNKFVYDVWGVTSSSTSTHSQEPLSELAVYPNPTVGNLNISTSAECTNLQLFNILGERVATYNCSSQITLNDVPIGAYFLIEVNENGQQIQWAKIQKH